MGLTSCKQGTEVDPTDPYATKKPVQPGTSTAGDADLTFTLTNADGGDLATLWANWQKNNADAAKELMAQDEITIALNFTNYKLDGKAIAVPNFFAKTADGKTLNLVISSFAEAKKALNMDLATNLAGADVNMFLPAAVFDMVLDAQGTKTTLDSEEGTSLTTFTGKADAVKKNALTIKDDVKVAGIDMSGALVASKDNIFAKLVGADETLEEGKGALVGNKDNGAVYVKNLIVTADAKISGTDKTALEGIVIAEKVKATIAGKKPQVGTIVGLGDFSKKEQSYLDFSGDENSFTNIESITNVEIDGSASDIKDMSIFTNVVFDMDVNVYTDIADTELLGDVNVNFDDGVEEINFSGVNFGSKSVMTVKGATKVTGKMTSVEMYQWDKAQKNYVVLDDEKDLYDTNTEYKEIVQNVSKTVPSQLTMKDGKFVYAAYDKNVKALEEAKKAYEAEIEAKGIEAANGTEATLGKITPTTVLQAYLDAYKIVYGDYEYEIYKKDDKGNWVDKDGKVTTDTSKRVPVKANPSALDEDDQTNTGNVGTTAYKFMTAVNPQIGDADWFEIYYAKEYTTQPEDVVVSFDDSTMGDAELTVKKLNKLINVDGDGYSSWKEIFFDVELDGESLQWAGTSTDGFYLK
jgi:hypothetical protein